MSLKDVLCQQPTTHTSVRAGVDWESVAQLQSPSPRQYEGRKQQVRPGEVKVECCSWMPNKGRLYNYDLARTYSEELNKS